MKRQLAGQRGGGKYVWRLLTERPRELIEPTIDESPVPGWVLIWMLILIKLFIGGAILFFFSAEDSLIFVIGTHWMAPAAIVALLWPLALFWGRLWRVRLRRAELQCAEWELEKSRKRIER